MHYEELTPPAELRGLVHKLWVLQGHSAGGPFQRAMPDGRAELIFNLGDSFECREGSSIRRQPPVLLVGQGRRAMAIRPTGRVDLVGVRFRPEALAGWLRVSGAELADRTFALSEFPASLDAALPDQLASARDPGRRLAILRQHLAAASTRVPSDPRLVAAVDMALADGRARPGAIGDAIGLSRRQLGRLLRERIGFGPKSLMRLGRFQRVLRALEGRHPSSLASMAIRAGYFDQAHLCRDFRLFAGISPARHLRQMRDLTRNFVAQEG
jgi:AraC-like DNA-binding protein